MKFKIALMFLVAALCIVAALKLKERHDKREQFKSWFIEDMAIRTADKPTPIAENEGWVIFAPTEIETIKCPKCIECHGTKKH